MATEQPVWELVANLGDASPIDYGGYFVYRDTTGVYDPQAEYLDAPETDAGEWYVYRFDLDRCTLTDGVLSDNAYHPELAAWFADSLEAVSRCVDYPLADLRADLCSDDPRRLAEAYRALAQYHGWDNFDSYPLTLTREEAEQRYDGLKPAFGERTGRLRYEPSV